MPGTPQHLHASLLKPGHCGFGVCVVLQVNLVLEFCDWGCLRDTLDAGAFFSAGSLNYAAILDTAADVAKAMLHLHCNQVWYITQ